MNQERDAFTEALEMELRRRGFACDRWALTDFVRGSWPLIEEDSDPAAWAQAFMDADAACGFALAGN
jgi:hypothetical protein